MHPCIRSTKTIVECRRPLGAPPPSLTLLGAKYCTPEINSSEIIVDFQWNIQNKWFLGAGFLGAPPISLTQAAIIIIITTIINSGNANASTKQLSAPLCFIPPGQLEPSATAQAKKTARRDINIICSLYIYIYIYMCISDSPAPHLWPSYRKPIDGDRTARPPPVIRSKTLKSNLQAAYYF